VKEQGEEEEHLISLQELKELRARDSEDKGKTMQHEFTIS